MKRVLVTGAAGQLGHDVLRQLTNVDAIGCDRAEMDLCDSQEIRDYLEIIAPDAIIHCGAYTAVDKAEDDRDMCFAVNEEATKEISEYCKRKDTLLIYISTDYVFDGTKPTPYLETDPPEPIGVYGLSKYLGETHVRQVKRHFIVRISWVFGHHGANFVKTMLKLSQVRNSLTVVADQYGSPTYTEDLAPILIKMLDSNKYGTYHATNEGFCSWFDFARKIFEVKGITMDLIPVTSDQYPTRAKRPANSRMSKSKLKESGIGTLPTWEDALKRFLQ